MSKLNIMTWNVDWFRNGRRSGSGDKSSYYYIDDCSEEICNSIISVIKEFLSKENAVVFLQEVPYYDKKGILHDLWNVFCRAFPEDDYALIYNKKVARKCTIAITKKDLFEDAKCFKTENRIIGVKNNDVEIVGVHMPTNFEEKDHDDEMWKNIIKYAENSKDNLILVGDFNAYIGCNIKLTEKRYLELLKFMGNCVSENISTFLNNSIDKIMLKKGDYYRNCSYQIIPQLENKYSDHKYLTIELELGSK